MKINKIILRIYHFFGLKKGKEHIDDVTMMISSYKWSKGEIERWNDNGVYRGVVKEDSDYVIEDTKEQIRAEFKKNPKFEKRCRNAHQVWIKIQEKYGIVKMLYYRDGILYYPYTVDIKIKERDDKLREVLK